jgi:hypothetical protein
MEAKGCQKFEISSPFRRQQFKVSVGSFKDASAFLLQAQRKACGP